jgi:hypothetical protein
MKPFLTIVLLSVCLSSSRASGQSNPVYVRIPTRRLRPLSVSLTRFRDFLAMKLI